MTKISDYKIVAGKKYKVYATAYSRSEIERDARILKKNGYKTRIVLDKDYEGGYRKFKKRYLALGRKD